MRIAAGVLLIIVSLINVVAAFGYVLGGEVAGAVGEAAEKDATATAAAKRDAAEAKSSGSTLKLFGAVLGLVTVLQIAGAVMLFRRKGKAFVIGVGALTLLAEVGGIALISFGILNVPGIVAALLTFAALASFQAKEAPYARSAAA